MRHPCVQALSLLAKPNLEHSICRLHNRSDGSAERSLLHRFREFFCDERTFCCDSCTIAFTILRVTLSYTHTLRVYESFARDTVAAANRSRIVRESFTIAIGKRFFTQIFEAKLSFGKTVNENSSDALWIPTRSEWSLCDSCARELVTVDCTV